MAERTPRRVLVTGAQGLIGSAVVRHLADEGIATTSLSLEGPLPEESDRHVIGDVTSTDVVDAAMRDVDAVVHLAAIPHPSLGTPEEVFRVNAIGTFDVLAAAARHGVRRAVLASSINAVGVPMNPHGAMPAYFPIDEDLPPDIADAYSLSKRVDEQIAQMAWRAWGIDSVALRFPLVRPLEVIREAARALRDPASAVREGWSYLDLDDAARAVGLALRVPLTGAHVVGLSAVDTMLPDDTADLLARFAPGVPVRRPLVGRESLVDTGRAERLLGFRPRRSLDEADAARGVA